MRFTSIVTALAASSFVTAREAFSDGGNLPENHILRGVPPKALNPRAASTLVTSATAAAPDASCTNGPTSRNCWSPGYSVATDFDQKWPTTGVTRYVSK